MIWEVLILGFVLSSTISVSIALGTVPFGLKRAVQVALTFGLWDGIMPLIGLMIGRRSGGCRGRRRDRGRGRLGVYGLYPSSRPFATPSRTSWTTRGRCSASR
jgi:hypothetical protein